MENSSGKPLPPRDGLDPDPKPESPTQESRRVGIDVAARTHTLENPCSRILARAVAFFVAKMALLSLIYFALHFYGDTSAFFDTEVRWPRKGPATMESHFAAWDGAHYLLLATEGYAKGVASCAFYPLWPLLIRAGSALGLAPLWSAILISNGLSAVAWSLFYSMAVVEIGRKAAKLATAFLALYPGGIFFEFPYSEAVFFLLLMLLWHSLTFGRFPWAIGSAVLLPLSRPVGVFIGLPILAWLLANPPVEWFGRWSRTLLRSRFHWLESEKCLASTGPPGLAKTTSGQRGSRWLFMIAAPVLGWCIYLFLMWWWTGNPWEGIRAQKHWGRHSILNIVNVPRFLVELANPSALHEFAGSVCDRIVFLLSLYTIPWMWRHRRGWIVWTYVLAVLPAMSGGFTSYLRFSSTAFPLFLVLGSVLSRSENRKACIIALACSTALQVVLFWRFVNFGWVG